MVHESRWIEDKEYREKLRRDQGSESEEEDEESDDDEHYSGEDEDE